MSGRAPFVLGRLKSSGEPHAILPLSLLDGRRAHAGATVGAHPDLRLDRERARRGYEAFSRTWRAMERLVASDARLLEGVLENELSRCSVSMLRRP